MAEKLPYACDSCGAISMLLANAKRFKCAMCGYTCSLEPELPFNDEPLEQTYNNHALAMYTPKTVRVTWVCDNCGSVKQMDVAHGAPIRCTCGHVERYMDNIEQGYYKWNEQSGKCKSCPFDSLVCQECDYHVPTVDNLNHIGEEQ